METAVSVTNESNQKLTPSQKDIPQQNFGLDHIGFQHVQWLICTGHLKIQDNYNGVSNYVSPDWYSWEFRKGRYKPSKVSTTKKNRMKEKYQEG